jgi:hypothetical protein
MAVPPVLSPAQHLDEWGMVITALTMLLGVPALAGVEGRMIELHCHDMPGRPRRWVPWALAVLAWAALAIAIAVCRA